MGHPGPFGIDKKRGQGIFEFLSVPLIGFSGQSHGPDPGSFEGFHHPALGLPEALIFQQKMFIQLSHERFDLFPVEKLPKPAHEFGLDFHHRMLAVQQTEDEKGRIGDKKDLAGKIQRVSQTDNFLAGDFGGKDVHAAHLGIGCLPLHNLSSRS
jgi:hypothetical protein